MPIFLCLGFIRRSILCSHQYFPLFLPPFPVHLLSLPSVHRTLLTLLLPYLALHVYLPFHTPYLFIFIPQSCIFFTSFSIHVMYTFLLILLCFYIIVFPPVPIAFTGLLYLLSIFWHVLFPFIAFSTLRVYIFFQGPSQAGVCFLFCMHQFHHVLFSHLFYQVNRIEFLSHTS